MGGRALKNTETRRYSREEFETASKELVNILKENFDRVDIPLFYREKETFGDIDIIVSNEEMDGVMIRNYIKTTFNPNEIFHNGNAWSFDYKEVQVDLIMVHPDDHDSNYHYLAYNDLGNFIGRLAQSIGVKFGQEGLWYVRYGEDNSTKHKIMLSKDFEKIYSFLGLDYNQFLDGFDKLEDIFEFVTTSHLFNPEMFQLNKLNNINRERNLKRKSYMSFLDYIEGKKPNHDYDADYNKAVKENIVETIRDYFPESNIDLELAVIEYNEAVSKLVKLKFNGKLIKEKYGLEGEELGNAILNFKENINALSNGSVYGDNFSDFIIHNSEARVWKSFELMGIAK